MANQEHLEILKQGMDAWNAMRRRYPSVRPDLSGTGLVRANLIGADLSRADLIRADLRGAYLNNADLSRGDFFRAILSGASLSRANLSEANLKGGDLEGANLIGADLRESNLAQARLGGANLGGANLFRANLSEAGLSETSFTHAIVGWTTFGDVDLSEAHSLETLNHHGPSTVGIDTIYRSKGKIPEAFLRGVGVPDVFVRYMASLMGEPIQFYSCFLSHASTDGQFADRLRSDLLSNGVSCWHYRYDMRGGQFWRVQINEAIKVHNKLVLICSEASLQRRNVVDEIIAAMERERETGSQKLFPIRLDDFILGDEMLALADQAMAHGQWREDWVRYVRAYHIPDFSGWKRDHDAYQREFQRLVEALKNPAGR